MTENKSAGMDRILLQIMGSEDEGWIRRIRRLRKASDVRRGTPPEVLLRKERYLAAMRPAGWNQ